MINLVADDPNLRGVHTRDEAPGAWANGTRIAKATFEAGDATPMGTGGTVLGSIHDDEHGFFYFVEWDDKRGYAVGCVARKLREEG